MADYVLAPEAEDDLFRIWQFLSQEAGVDTADRVEQEILRAFGSLAEMPGKGHRRSDLTREYVLFYRIYQYMVIFRVRGSLEILAIVHGRRDVSEFLRERL